MKIVYPCQQIYQVNDGDSFFHPSTRLRSPETSGLVCGCNSSVQSSAWHRVSKIDIYWQKEWIHFWNSSVPPYLKPVTVCNLNACGHCTLEVWSSLWSHTWIQIPAWTLQLCDLGWVSWVLIFSLSLRPLGVVLTISFWQDCKRWNRLRSNLCSPWCLGVRKPLALFEAFLLPISYNVQFICRNSHL